MNMDNLVQWLLIVIILGTAFIILDHRGKFKPEDLCKISEIGELKTTIIDKGNKQITLICTGVEK